MTSTTGNQPRGRRKPTAQKLLRTALETYYRFPPSFAGFTASVEAIRQESDHHDWLSGIVKVTGPHDIELEAEGPETLKSWVIKEFHSMLGFRWRGPYEYDQSTLLMEGDPASQAGCVITVENDPYNSVYRIRDGEMVEWSNTIGLIKTIRRTMCHLQAPQGTKLPESFSVILWSTMANTLLVAETYSDQCEIIDDLMLPRSRRRISVSAESQSSYEFQVSNWKLL